MGPVTPSGRRLPGRTGVCLMAGLSVLCFVTVACLAMVVNRQWPTLMASDLSIDTAVHQIVRGAAPVIDVALVLQLTGSPVFLTTLTTCVVVVLLARRRPGYAVYLATTALGGVVLSESFKDLIARQRPVWPDPLSSAAGYSFPSGHSLAGVTNWVVYGVIVLMLIPGAKGRVFATILMTWGLLMAPSRVALGVHWPSDVIGGWLLGFGWVLAVSAAAVVLVTHREAARAAPA